MPPKVSVVMSVFNAGVFLRDAVDSVLAQTFKDFEFIIINDGSTDETASTLATYADPRIRVINQSNQGLVHSLNRGITEARAPLIARMDADDLCTPDRLQVQVDYLEKHPVITLLGAWIETIDEKGRTLAPVMPLPIRHQELWSTIARKSMVICHPAVMFRRQAALDVGLYDPSFSIAEDTEFFARLMSKYRAAAVPRVLLRYRLVRSGMSSTRKELGLQNSSMIADMIDHWKPGQLLKPTDEQRKLASSKPAKNPEAASFSEIESSYRLRVARELLRGAQWKRAGKQYLRAARHKPFNWVAYAGIGCAILRKGAAKPEEVLETSNHAGVS